MVRLVRVHLVSVETGGESNTVTRSTTRITVFCTQGEGVQTFHLGSFSLVFFFFYPSPLEPDALHTVFYP